MDEADAQSVLALLREAREHGIGLMFEPDLDEDGNDCGWTINYVIHGWPAVQGQSADYPGDQLSSAYDLQTAVAAALKPLRELGLAYGHYLDHLNERDRGA